MDPLSVVCGVAGLIGLAQVVVKEGYNYISTSKDCRSDIRNLINEVSGLSGILVALKTTVDNLGNSGYSPGITKHQQITDCEDILQQLKDLLQKINPTSKAKESSILPKKVQKKPPQTDPVPGFLITRKTQKFSVTERIKDLINNAGKIVKWPLNKEETEELMKRLERHKSTFILTFSADSASKVMDILDEAKETNYYLTDIRSEQDRVADEKREEDRMKKLHWLFPGDTDEKHIDVSRKRHEGTGTWFFNTEEFKHWLSEPSWLFCHGKAGAGKTVLTSSVLDYITKVSRDMKGTPGLAHIYCGFKDRDNQTPTKIFASILRQLGFRTPELPSEVESLYEEFGKKGKTPPLGGLVRAIISLAGNFSCVWLFFDALDECEENTLQDILSCIRDLMKTNIKGFVTSRSHVSNIRSTFENATTVELSARREDIEIFVRSRLSTRSVPLPVKLVEDIVSRILEKADGIFLLVAFQVEFIIGKKRPADVRKCLDRLPTGLEEIYTNILQKINHGDDDNRKLALNALSWISHATRPLSPKELCEALTVMEDDTEIDEEYLVGEKDLVDVCGGLVMIDKESKTIRFVHYTVQEYLDKINDVSRGAHAHTMIAKTCLTYLSFNTFDECPDSGMDRPFLRRRLLENSFYEYAARNWGYHTKSSSEENSVVEMICKFSKSGNRVESALHVFFFESLQHDYEYLSSTRNTFSVAAIFGLPRLTQALIELGDLKADLKDENYTTDIWTSKNRTPLSRAAEHGHLEVVQLLVDRDDVVADSKDGYGRTPLSNAAENGHLAVVQLLVDRDDVVADEKDDYGRTPLSYAARNGLLAVVQLLVDRDDVVADEKDSGGRTPLSYAARNGHLAVVQLLVDRDDVVADEKDNYGQTPLSNAAMSGHLAVVQLLVDRDDVVADEKDSDGRTPLSYAAENGHLAVVQLLVDRDDVVADEKDNYDQTPLSYAARNGHLAVVQLLVDRDDVVADEKDSGGRTPLSNAAMGGHLAVVQLLVDRDDVVADEKDNYDQTPLSYAARNGLLAVVQLLVDRDDVVADEKDKYGQTPLSYAARNGHLAVVQLLVDRDDVVVNSENNNGKAPLYWAEKHENLEMIKLLKDIEKLDAEKLKKREINLS